MRKMVQKMIAIAVAMVIVLGMASVTYTLDDFAGEGKVVKRGKKKFAKVIAAN